MGKGVGNPLEVKFFNHKYPRSAAELLDVAPASEQHLWSKYAPAERLLESNDLVMTMGSCFARNLGEALGRRGLSGKVYRVYEEANSPLLNELLLDCLINEKPSVAASELFSAEISAEMGDQFLADLKSAAGFILTVGVGICCYEKKSGKLVVRPNAREHYDCAWRVIEPKEAAQSIRRFIDMLKGINPLLDIVVTVSPVPLFRSFQTPSAFVEDCLSKSALRLAVHEVVEHDSSVHYWPTFEFFRWLGSHVDPVFGAEDNLPRHPNREYVQIAVDAFIRHFFNASAAPSREEGTSELILVPDN